MASGAGHAQRQVLQVKGLIAVSPEICLIGTGDHVDDLPQVVQNLAERLHRVLKGDDLQSDAGMAGGGPAPLLQQQIGRVHQGHADADGKLPGRPQLFGLAQHHVRVADHLFRLTVNELSGFGEGQPLGAAVE